VRAGAGVGILHTFTAGRDTNLIPVLAAYTLSRSYWTVVHEDLRTIRRATLVGEFLAKLVARDWHVFS